jgi:hypothetical protein
MAKFSILGQALSVAVVFYGVPLFFLLAVACTCRLIWCLWTRSFTYLYYVVPAYFAFLIYDWQSPRTGSKLYSDIRASMPAQILPAALEYFPIQVHACQDVMNTLERKDGPFLFGYHPHGILPFGAIMQLNINKLAFGNLAIKAATLQLHFWIPIWRELAQWVGFVHADMTSCLACLDKPDGALLISLGGARESVDTFARHQMILTIRKGFFRLAFKAGATIVPLLAFGELAVFAPLEIKKGRIVKALQNFFYSKLGTCHFSLLFFSLHRHGITSVQGKMAWWLNAGQAPN